MAKTLDNPRPNYNRLKNRPQLLIRRKRKIAFAKCIGFQENAVITVNTIKLPNGDPLREHIHRCSLYRDFF